jgi:hypothetical protein
VAVNKVEYLADNVVGRLVRLQHGVQGLRQD